MRSILFPCVFVSFYLFAGSGLVAQAFDPTLIEDPEKTEREKREDAERRQREKEEREARRKEAMDDYWIRLNPGFLLSSTSLTISGQGFRSGTDATMVNRRSFGKPDWMLDMKTKDFPLTQHWGVHVLAHTRTFDLKYQSYKETVTADDGSESSETVVEDLGTRMRGYYALTVPVVYYNVNGKEEGFRFGVGYGPSVVRLQGSAALDSGLTLAPLFLAQDRDTMVRDLQLNTLVQGSINFREGDPVYGSLLLGLRDAGGLERMGVYLMARGDIKTDITTLFLIHYLTSGQAPGNLLLTPLEAVGAVGLANLNLDFREDFAPSYFIHGEYVWKRAVIRLALGGPIFSRGGFRYSLTGVILSFSVPVRF
ncbi:MAG: hypothetical protein CMN77_02275 [Spirochaetaceae bacterium]|nr:hypothetical protein [Spirochaetaceae bacterium]|tara:strand:- start:25835 stop:26935 length:1101 start_codon:yes stop_codon:yes gene_type:complete